MSEEFQSAEAAPVSDAPAASDPVTSEPTSDSQMSVEMEAAYDAAQEPGYRKPAEWKQEPPPSEVPVETPDLEAQETGEQQTSDIAPPVSLNAKAREHWASLPTPVKEFIAEREAQATQKITELGQYAKAAKELAGVFQEFSGHLPTTADGQTIPERDTVRLLLAAHRALEENPEAALRWLAESKGLSLDGLGEADVEQLQQRAYAQAQQQFQQQWQWEQQKQEWERHQRQTQKVQAHVEAFTRDKPHWAQIEADVLYFIPAEKAKKPHGEPTEWFQAAYDKAMAGRPDLDQTKKAETKKAADQARRVASMNVKSIGNAARRAGTNWQDDLGRIYDQIAGRRA